MRGVRKVKGGYGDSCRIRLGSISRLERICAADLAPTSARGRALNGATVAGDPLVRSVPIFARKHSVVVSRLTDPDVERLINSAADSIDEGIQTAVAVDMLEPRSLLVSRLSHGGG